MPRIAADDDGASNVTYALASNAFVPNIYMAEMSKAFVEKIDEQILARILYDSAGMVAPPERNDTIRIRSPKIVKPESQLPEGKDWGTARRELDL